MESSKFYCPRSEAVPRSALGVASFFHQSSSTHSCWTISESGYDIRTVPTLYKFLYHSCKNSSTSFVLQCTKYRIWKLLNYQLEGSWFQKLIDENSEQRHIWLYPNNNFQFWHAMPSSPLQQRHIWLYPNNNFEFWHAIFSICDYPRQFYNWMVL